MMTLQTLPIELVNKIIMMRGQHKTAICIENENELFEEYCGYDNRDQFRLYYFKQNKLNKKADRNEKHREKLNAFMNNVMLHHELYYVPLTKKIVKEIVKHCLDFTGINANVAHIRIGRQQEDKIQYLFTYCSRYHEKMHPNNKGNGWVFKHLKNCKKMTNFIVGGYYYVNEDNEIEDGNSDSDSDSEDTDYDSDA